MTTEEMQAKWPLVPPFECDEIKLMGKFRDDYLYIDITQDSIDDIIAYFQAAKESMNS